MGPHHPRRCDGTPRTGNAGGLDVPGAVTATTALLLLVTALGRAPEVGWAAPATLLLLALAVRFAIGFVVIERRTREPLVRLALLRSGATVRANVGAMALLGGWISALFILTLYMQQIRDWSPLETGLAVAPSGVMVAVLAPRIAAPLVALRCRVAGGLVNTSFQIGPVLALAAVAAVIDTNASLPGLRAALLVPLVATLIGMAFTAAGLRTGTPRSADDNYMMHSQ